MATITGSSGSNWSGISFPALDLGGDFAALAARFSSAFNAFVNFQFSVISASSTQLKVHLNAFGVEGVLTLKGSGFDSAPLITSITFDADGSDELVRLAGRIDGRGSESLTSFTYVSPDGEYSVSAAGSFSLNPLSTSISGRATSITILDDGGSKIVLTGSATVSGSGFGATLSGNITAIAISGAGGTATITGLSLPYSTVNGIDSPADLLALAPLLAGNDKITFSSSIGIALDGGAGNDTLTGGGFADTLIGGAGDDTYTVTVLGQDTLSEAADQGSDTARLLYNVLVATTVDVGTFDNIENIEAAGTGAFHLTGDGADNRLTGNATGNTLTGGGGDDVLDGRGGVDTMTGGEGNDLYVLDRALDVFTEETGQGSDTVRLAYSVSVTTTVNLATQYGGNVENVWVTGAGVFHLTGNTADNALTANGSNNILDGATGDDTLAGGGGNDSYFVDSADDVIVEAAGGGTDIVRSAGSYALSANVEHLILLGAGQGTGNASHNAINGSDGADTLVGGAGNDTLRGGLGDDTYVIGVGADTIIDTGGHDRVQSSASVSLAALTQFEDIELTGSANVNATGNGGVNVLTGNEGNNILDGGAGADTLIGGDGNDILVVRSLADDSVLEALDEGTDTVRLAFNTAAPLTVNLGDEFANVENMQVLGTGAFHLIGTDAANTLTGNASANSLTGGAGDDTLDGKGGLDTMLGGLGNDTYFIDRLSDIVTEADGEGSDTLVVAFNVSSATTINLIANVEHATVTGTGAFRVIGNGADNVLTGNASANRLTGAEGNDTLDGKGGVDTLVGGAGNDRLLVTSLSEVVDESGGGIDVVRVVLSTTSSTTVDLAVRFGGNVENLEVDGPGRFNLLGNAAGNVLIGNAKDNTLNGRAGADTLQGGAGNDTYFVDHAGDLVNDDAGSADTLFADVDAILASLGGGELAIDLQTAWAGIERVTLTGTGAARVTGTIAADSITGNAGANTLDGGAGADTLIGGLGNDRYVIDPIGADVIIEAAGGGTDTVVSNVFSFTLGTNLENLELTAGGVLGFGNAGSNVLTGLDNSNNSLHGLGGDDTLAGGAGTDALDGGAGNDVLDGGSDNDTLQGAEGNDALHGGGGDDFLDGAAGNDTLEGDAGNDTLQGGTGADSMAGGAGDDRYLVDDAADQADESALGSDGDDTVIASVSYTLGAGIEHLELTSGAAGTGNALDNNITGNSTDNTLDGGAGSDTLIGGGGNDRYLVNSFGDQIDETADGSDGTDVAVSSAFSYTLSADVENLELAAGALVLNGAGNDLANLITGNASDNLLAGAGGNDTLLGGGGNDTLDGGSGADSLVGGAGNDLYVIAAMPPPGIRVDVNGTADAIIVGEHSFTQENGTLGVNEHDLTGDGLVDSLVVVYQPNGGGLFSFFEFSTRGLNANLVPGEYLDAVRYPGAPGDGHPSLDVSSNGLGSNTVTGEFIVEFADFDYSGESPVAELVLISFVHHREGGANSLVGTLSINLTGEPLGEQIVELDGGGIDTVQSGNDHTLAANIENLVLTGSANIDGAGNALDNQITGNDGDNILSGLDGNDSLVGGSGADSLVGGAGNDLYFVDDGNDIVVELLSAALGGGTDQVRSAIDYTLTVNVEELELDGSAIHGSGNELANTIIGNAQQNELYGHAGNDSLFGGEGNDILDGGSGADQLSGGMGDDTYYVDDADDDVREPHGSSSGTDTVVASVSYALPGLIDFVENLELVGAGNLTGTGNDLSNVIVGNSGHNTLAGLLGVDTLSGGDGDDAYILDDSDTASATVDTGSGTRSFAGYAPDIADAFDSLADEDELVDMLVFNISDYPNNEDPGSLSLIISTRNYGAALQTGTYLNAQRAQFEDSGHPGIDISLDGGGFNTLNGSFTINILEFDYSGASPSITALDVDFDVSTFGKHWTGTVSFDSSSPSPADLVIEDSGEGHDRVETPFSYALVANVEDLTLTGSASASGTGNDLANAIVGNGGSNALDGKDGDDTLTGGAGNDDFVFSVAGGVDTLTDFASGADSILLDADVFAGLVAGALDIDAFVSGAGMVAAGDADDRIIHDSTTGDLYYDADGVDGEAAVKFATLTGAPALAASDFEVV